MYRAEAICNAIQMRLSIINYGLKIYSSLRPILRMGMGHYALTALALALVGCRKTFCICSMAAMVRTSSEQPNESVTDNSMSHQVLHVNVVSSLYNKAHQCAHYVHVHVLIVLYTMYMYIIICICAMGKVHVMAVYLIEG